MSALVHKNNQFKQRDRNQYQRYRRQYGDNIISNFDSISITPYGEISSMLDVINNKFSRELIGVENIVKAAR